ncbi:hypothetical protein [Methylobacterium dankookense]|uniref:Uncharacterized protein n=1 Tax=Methylobacterium dankookense TaxID=560405 RepID=A0A564G1C8_9HYPH|nr:hypothetical protein [Methylobacterium dankookense]GJD55145.1 hypothetical protein IFDJLNFL_1027 [Methylobacterium dankookense]VUF13758.1 hypothetical protein MTDSW087_03465 [Methylobacterium dankookense]
MSPIIVHSLVVGLSLFGLAYVGSRLPRELARGLPERRVHAPTSAASGATSDV